MSCIVYITNKKTNTKYAYRSESYRDPITKQPKSRRTYIGRVDPVTNEIIPKAEKGKRNCSPIGINSSENSLPTLDTSRQQSIAELQEQVGFLKKQQIELKEKITGMDNLISRIQALVQKIDS